MADESTPASPTPDTPPPRTTGGGFRWEPPTAAELQALMPGYTIEKILGRGGMGAVYRGVQTNLDRPVAIKILPPGVEKEDPSFAERFKSEARLMAKLSHPAVVGVYDFGTNAGGQLYFAMEYVDGSDVSQMIAAQGKLPPEHALAITAHVCDALQAAHELGIVHRDIKPANVLLNMKGQVKVADFGLAKVEDPGQHGLTKTGYAMGTPDFVAPEALMLGTAIDGRADLYAVGVMLYQMLTGNIPRGAFKPASVLVPGLDPRFDPIILKAMQHDREERHQNAAELRRELDVILTVPFVRQNAPASAAIPVAQMAQAPGQRSAAQKPVGKPPQPKSTTDTPVRRDAAPADRSVRGTSQTTTKSKTPLFIGLGAAAAIGIGAFVMMGGKKDVARLSKVESASPPASKPPTLESRATAKPQPKPTESPKATAAASPPPPASKSSEKFPPGQWVKVFTKAEDLPESLRRPETGVKWENGTVIATKAGQFLGLIPIPSVMKNMALRGEISGSFTIRLRDNAMANYYGFWQNAIDYYDRRIEDKSRARQVPRTFATPSAHEVHSWEFAVIGTTLTVRLDGKIVASVTDSQISSGTITFSNLVGSFKNLEVINLDGLAEAEALKILGVDEKGHDLRQPAAVASASPAPSVSKSPPLPVSKSSTTPVSSSPSLLVSKSSDPKFPPGHWVKVFTKFEDLPEHLRKSDSGVKFEDGWIRIGGKQLGLPMPVNLTSNYGIRLRVLRSDVLNQPEGIVLRGQPRFEGKPSGHYQVKLAGNQLQAQRLESGKYVVISNDFLPNAPAAGQEFVIEFAAVGERLISRVGDSFIKVFTDDKWKIGAAYLNFAEDVRDIEVINLVGLPEAEALRILGVDEKGNDLRALAAKQEQQMAEQAKAVDAMAAIPELKTLHEQFVKLQAERVTAPFEADVAKLNVGYVGGIDREIANEKKAGHLDGVIALETEKKLIQGVGTSLSPQTRDQDGPAPCPIPAEDDAATTEALKKLRGIYRSAYAKIEATRAENLKTLTDPLSLRLKQLESTLTQQDRVADAKTVREYRDGLGKEGLAGTPARSSQNGGATAKTDEAEKSLRAPLKKFPPGDDRKAAEWVLSVGGSVGIAGNSARITDVAELPRGRFDVRAVYLEFTATKGPLVPVDNLLPLAGLKELTLLNLKFLPVTAAHLEILASLPALREMHFSNSGITDESFQHLAGTRVGGLEFTSETRITGVGIEALAAAKSMQWLTLQGVSLTEEGLRQIGRLKTLRLLTLGRSTSLPRDEHLPLLGGLDKLESLSLRRTPVTAEALAAQKQWSGLTSLGFDFTPGQSAKQAVLLAAAFPKLETLITEGDPTLEYTADYLVALKSFPRLNYIAFLLSPITDETLASVLDLDQLEIVRLSTCPRLTDAAVETLGRHKKVNHIILESLSQVTDASLTHLAKLSTLRTLELKSCPSLTPDAIAVFQKARPDVTVTR